MPPNFEPKTPIEAHKAIIDQLVEETSKGVSERLVRDSGIYSKAPGKAAANELVQTLSKQQRELLATMLRQERVGAIHDVLAVLTWWQQCREVGLTFRGNPMPFELSGMGMHGDFVGRLDDWEWPSDGKPA
jgi:hypothetical protein